MQYLGTPYVWGGLVARRLRLLGFVMYVFAQMGVSLPHNAAAQYNYGVPVSRDQLEPGDLVFFDGLGHVGIYIGGGQFIHAPHTGDVVKISCLERLLVRRHVRRRPAHHLGPGRALDLARSAPARRGASASASA